MTDAIAELIKQQNEALAERDAANRTVVEQAATIEAVRALADVNAPGSGPFIPSCGHMTTPVIHLSDLRAVLPPVDGEK